VIAIGALHQASLGRKHYLDLDACTNEAVLHHRYALKQYGRAIKAMKEAVTSGTQDLRTTLITCLVIVVFEAFHGNSTIADNQIQTGVSLIQEWKATYPSPRVVKGISSPNPYIIEDELVEAFARLELQTNYRGDGRSPSLHEALGRDADSHIENMPKEFTSLDSARTYLEVIMRRQQHLAFVAAEYHRSPLKTGNWKQLVLTSENASSSSGGNGLLRIRCASTRNIRIQSARCALAYK
jgi:hypothetical protein